MLTSLIDSHHLVREIFTVPDNKLSESAEDSKTVEEQPEEESPWGAVGGGLFLIAAGIGLYFLFAHWEQEGGARRMNAIVLLLYKLLGKTGVAVVFCGLGSLLTVSGIKGLLSKKD